MVSSEHLLRVVVDANVLISYLLHISPDSPITRVVAGALNRSYTLLIPPGLANEMLDAVVRSGYLAARIMRTEAAELLDRLRTVGITLPTGAPLAVSTRDPRDDYLLAYALWGEADLLVTGDQDLLSLRAVGRLRIVSPRECVQLLGETT